MDVNEMTCMCMVQFSFPREATKQVQRVEFHRGWLQRLKKKERSKENDIFFPRLMRILVCWCWSIFLSPFCHLPCKTRVTEAASGYT